MFRYMFPQLGGQLFDGCFAKRGWFESSQKEQERESGRKVNLVHRQREGLGAEGDFLCPTAKVLCESVVTGLGVRLR